jgi:hypothetical protein
VEGGYRCGAEEKLTLNTEKGNAERKISVKFAIYGRILGFKLGALAGRDSRAEIDMEEGDGIIFRREGFDEANPCGQIFPGMR